MRLHVMFVAIRLIVVASIISLSIMPLPLFAEQTVADKNITPAAYDLTGNFTLISDYLFRGESLSGGKMAVQGGIDYVNDNGLYIGTWASSLENEVPLELDIYIGFEKNIARNSSFFVELRAYVYPHAENEDILEPTIAALLYDARLQYHYNIQLESHYLEASYQYAFSKTVDSEFRAGLVSNEIVPENTEQNIWDLEFNIDYKLTVSTMLQGELVYHEIEKSTVAIGITTLFSL